MRTTALRPTSASPLVGSGPVDPMLARLFADAFGVPATNATPIAAQGSKRRMVRLHGGGRTAIAVIGPDAHENRAFVAFSRDLLGAGVPVPEILATALDESGAYLVEDLGDLTLFQALEATRRDTPTANLPSALRPAYERTLRSLVSMQLDGGRAIDYGNAYPTKAFDARPSDGISTTSSTASCASARCRFTRHGSSATSRC